MPLICNVRFTVQYRRLQCLQRTIEDIALELQLPQVSPGDVMSANREISTLGNTAGSIHVPLCERLWLRRMLFPMESNAVQRMTLPSAKFRQSWYRKNLNYEQMVRSLCIRVAEFFGRSVFATCYPMPWPGTWRRSLAPAGSIPGGNPERVLVPTYLPPRARACDSKLET